MKFPGFTKVYQDASRRITSCLIWQLVKRLKWLRINQNQHFTLPPARYTEAALIKTLESNGVGRPSTYAPTLNTIQKRYYVKLVARKFEPTELGEIVNQMYQGLLP